MILFGKLINNMPQMLLMELDLNLEHSFNLLLWEFSMPGKYVSLGSWHLSFNGEIY